METGFMNRIIGLVLALVVGGLLVGGLLIPSIEAITTTEKTFDNSGLYYMENPTESITVSFLGDSQWEINGEPLVYTSIGATNIIVTNDTFVRNIGQVRGANYATWTDAELTIGNGTITGTATVNGNSTAVSWAYDYVYVATNEKAANIMKSNAADSYIKADSEILGMGLSTVKDSSGNNNTVEFKIVVEDLTATVTTTNQYVTVSDVQVNATAVDGYKDLYLFKSVTFTATWGTYTTAVTYNIVIVPSSVTAELSQHLDATQIAMFGVVSILGIVALVVVAANGIRNKY